MTGSEYREQYYLSEKRKLSSPGSAAELGMSPRNSNSGHQLIQNI